MHIRDITDKLTASPQEVTYVYEWPTEKLIIGIIFYPGKRCEGVGWQQQKESWYPRSATKNSFSPFPSARGIYLFN